MSVCYFTSTLQHFAVSYISEGFSAALPGPGGKKGTKLSNISFFAFCILHPSYVRQYMCRLNVWLCSHRYVNISKGVLLELKADIQKGVYVCISPATPHWVPIVYTVHTWSESWANSNVFTECKLSQHKYWATSNDMPAWHHKHIQWSSNSFPRMKRDTM